MVQHIDMAKGIVTFNNNGVVQEIPLVAGVASGGATGAARGGGGFQPPQAAGFGARPNYNNTLQNFRQRMQQQRMGNQNGINPTGNNFNPSGQSSYNGGYNNPNSSTPQLSSDDAAALIAAQHAQLEQSGDPKATIFPPTKFDDEARQEAGGGGTAAAMRCVGYGSRTTTILRESSVDERGEGHGFGSFSQRKTVSNQFPHIKLAREDKSGDFILDGKIG